MKSTLKAAISKFGIVHLVREDTGKSIAVVFQQRESPHEAYIIAGALAGLWNEHMIPKGTHSFPDP